ncbi:uncharacterized protein TNCV_4962221 [Trichonephila clavipes]|nr:uncharacterized protein TNCV_4962221 [Trichonephila clavipes]
MRLPLSEPREIYKDSLATDNRSNIGSEFTFEIDLPGKRDRSTIYRLNLIKLYRRKPELANLVMENSSEGIDSETLYSVKLFMDFGFQGSYCTPPPLLTEKHKDSDPNHDLNNYSEALSNSNNAKNKKKKRKIKKDSAEDFVFPKKTARPVSPLISEPVTVNNIVFQILNLKNNKEQVAPEEK